MFALVIFFCSWSYFWPSLVSTWKGLLGRDCKGGWEGGAWEGAALVGGSHHHSFSETTIFPPTLKIPILRYFENIFRKGRGRGKTTITLLPKSRLQELDRFHLAWFLTSDKEWGDLDQQWCNFSIWCISITNLIVCTRIVKKLLKAYCNVFWALQPPVYHGIVGLYSLMRW